MRFGPKRVERGRARSFGNNAPKNKLFILLGRRHTQHSLYGGSTRVGNTLTPQIQEISPLNPTRSNQIDPTRKKSNLWRHFSWYLLSVICSFWIFLEREDARKICKKKCQSSLSANGWNFEQ